MRLLAEIDRKPGIAHNGKTITREAVRAIVLENGKLLLIHSSYDGDYKFPGGGIKSGEDHHSALSREVNEESGAHLKTVTGEYGQVIEYDRPIEKKFDLFKMTSYYYLCEIDSHLGVQHLDEYEYELGFTPEWIDIEDAITINQTLLDKRPQRVQRWVNRETTVLRLLKNDFPGG